jgi:hypothetical protein
MYAAQVFISYASISLQRSSCISWNNPTAILDYLELDQVLQILDTLWRSLQTVLQLVRGSFGGSGQVGEN